MARAAATLAGTISRDAGISDQLEATWELASGLVALADSHQAVLKAMQPPISLSSFTSSPKLNALKIAANAAGGADGLWKMYKGTRLLFSDEGDLGYELRQGRSLRASMQACKGVLQIASGVVGVVAAIPATAALAATPVGLLIAIGASIVSATLDVALDATQEFEDHVSEFERALDAAEREELHEARLRVSTTVRDACAYAQQFG